MSEVGMDILTTVCEAGGIVTVIGLILALLIRLMKRNGCTLKCYHFNGKPFIELDCEQGAATRRYAAASPGSDSGVEMVDPQFDINTRTIKPSDIKVKK